MVDAQLFVNIAKTVFGGYSAMMLLMPILTPRRKGNTSLNKENTTR